LEEVTMEAEKQVPREDEMYCPSCGAVIKKEAEICVHCGVRVRRGVVSVTEGGPTAKPVVGGIFGIVAGVVPLIAGIVLVSIGATASNGVDGVEWAPIGIGIVLLALGIVTIVGSSYAIMRTNFPLAVAGGVCSVFSFWPLGIPALILIAISSKEFYPVPETSHNIT
jgi:hypothetical protein